MPSFNAGDHVKLNADHEAGKYDIHPHLPYVIHQGMPGHVIDTRTKDVTIRFQTGYMAAHPSVTGQHPRHLDLTVDRSKVDQYITSRLPPLRTSTYRVHTLPGKAIPKQPGDDPAEPPKYENDTHFMRGETTKSIRGQSQRFAWQSDKNKRPVSLLTRLRKTAGLPMRKRKIFGDEPPKKTEKPRPMLSPADREKSIKKLGQWSEPEFTEPDYGWAEPALASMASRVQGQSATPSMQDYLKQQRERFQKLPKRERPYKYTPSEDPEVGIHPDTLAHLKAIHAPRGMYQEVNQLLPHLDADRAERRKRGEQLPSYSHDLMKLAHGSDILHVWETPHGHHPFGHRNFEDLYREHTGSGSYHGLGPLGITAKSRAADLKREAELRNREIERSKERAAELKKAALRKAEAEPSKKRAAELKKLAMKVPPVEYGTVPKMSIPIEAASDFLSGKHMVFAPEPMKKILDPKYRAATADLPKIIPAGTVGKVEQSATVRGEPFSIVDFGHPHGKVTFSGQHLDKLVKHQTQESRYQIPVLRFA